jgi:mono/diheme cytochrome c family protein
MSARQQRESFLLGFIPAAIASFFAVLIISLTPILSDDGASVSAADTAPTTTTATNPMTAGRGGPPEGRGMGMGMLAENADPLSFGTADPDVVNVFNSAGCVACHAIKGVGGAGSVVGPHLYMTGAMAATRRPGNSAEAYIRESILDPNAFIMPNCPTGACPSDVMPQTFADTLSPEDLNIIVAYLAALGTSAEAEVLNQS